MSFYDTAEFLLNKIGPERKPVIGIICGTGLNGLSKCLTDQIVFKYENIPGFPVSTVQGHDGELVFGNLNGLTCVCMKGRFHYYEGNDMEKVVFPVRVMRVIGVKLLVVTNAAGGLNENYNVGDIMVIQDHFGLPGISGIHPLRGPNDDHLGPRFPSVSDAYDEYLQELVKTACDDLKLSHLLRLDGCYCYVSGPTYESRAECRFLMGFGGDSVGMSTVPEVIVAKHSGMKILGMSLITDMVVVKPDDRSVSSHERVLEAVASSGANMENIIRHVVTPGNLHHVLLKVPDFVVPDRKKKSGWTSLVVPGLLFGLAYGISTLNK